MSSILWEPPIEVKPLRFWPRQFALVPTRAQDRFDAIFGVILPVLCFMADPVYFKTGFMNDGEPIFARFQLVVYLITTVEMGSFLVWRTFRKHVSGYAPIFAGVFFAGAVFSCVIGLAMLPLTIFALLFLIGVFGLIPFVTAFAYFRSGVRAMRIPRTDLRSSARLAGVVLGATLAITLPFVVSTEWERVVSTSVNTLISGNAREAEAAAHRLKRLRVVPAKYRGEIENAYRRESDPAKKEFLRRAYEDLTGDDPSVRSVIFD